MLLLFKLNERETEKQQRVAISHVPPWTFSTCFSPWVACAGKIWGSALIFLSPSFTLAPKQAPRPGVSCLQGAHRPPSALAAPRPVPTPARLLPTTPLLRTAARMLFSNAILCISLFPRNRSLTHDCHVENKNQALQLGVETLLIQFLLLLPLPSWAPSTESPRSWLFAHMAVRLGIRALSHPVGQDGGSFLPPPPPVSCLFLSRQRHWC